MPTFYRILNNIGIPVKYYPELAIKWSIYHEQEWILTSCLLATTNNFNCYGQLVLPLLFKPGAYPLSIRTM